MRHWRGLDGLRAFAVLIVFAGHLARTPLRGGFIGVDVFFVLSGFLITGLLIREHDRTGSVSLRAFFARRALRLYPALILLCVVALPLAAVSKAYAVSDTAVGLGSALVYCFNLVALLRHHPSLVGNLWSLSVEEQYYLLWAPSAALLLARRGLGRELGRVLALLTALGWLVLLLTAIVFGREGIGQAYFQLHGHLVELFAGGLLAWAVQQDRFGDRFRGATAPTFALLVLLAAAAAIGRVDGPRMVVLYPLLAFCSAVLIGHLVTREDSWIGRLLTLPPVRWLGTRSYAFYLFHRPVIHLVEEHVYPRGQVTVISLLISLALSALSWRLVESRALARKGRFARVPAA